MFSTYLWLHCCNSTRSWEDQSWSQVVLAQKQYPNLVPRLKHLSIKWLITLEDIVVRGNEIICRGELGFGICSFSLVKSRMVRTVSIQYSRLENHIITDDVFSQEWAFSEFFQVLYKKARKKGICSWNFLARFSNFHFLRRIPSSFFMSHIVICYLIVR